MDEFVDGRHKVIIDNQEMINVSCAEEILSSTEKEVFVKVNGKEVLQIKGEGLKIIKLIPEEKMLTISGKVNGLLYSSRITKKSLFGKVFK